MWLRFFLRENDGFFRSCLEQRMKNTGMKETEELLMTKFRRLEKLNYSICQTGVSGFGSFRTKLRKELNLKI
jgi:hypothetical protein